jgi:hypothetical protein
MKIKVTYTKFNVLVPRLVAKVYRVTPFGLPDGVTTSAFTQEGGILVGTGAGAYIEKAPGTDGTYLKYDSTAAGGVTADIPALDIADSANHLINGGFDFAQRQAPGSLTTIADGAYSADRWMIERENADLQYIRQDAAGETGLTCRYYGQWKKITNAGKFLICQPLEFADSLPFRGKTINFQVKMKCSDPATVKISIVQLAAAGTADTIPATIAAAWGADTVNPTLGANLASIATPVSCSVETTWQTFQITADYPATAKNLVVMIWTDSDWAVDETLSVAEAGLYFGSTLRSWTPRPIAQELALARRYCFAMDQAQAINLLGQAMREGTAIIDTPLRYPVEMRANPTLGQIGSTAWAAAGPSGNQVAFYNYAASAYATITGGLTLAIVDTGKTGAMLRCTAATSFSGTAGDPGILYAGNAAYLYLSAEL